MAGLDIIRQRLLSHRLTGVPFESPQEAVSRLGAVQAQEYPGAKWGLAQRMNGISDAQLNQAFAAGAILRTHVMRPTWHFVTPADIRWILTLTAPRVNAVSAYYYRKLELDEAVFAQARLALEKALQGGKQLTRTELHAALLQARLISEFDDRLRFSYVLMRLELDGVLCSGALRGKQHTYTLLEERVPPAPPLSRPEALAELTLRYFSSHGPATLKDFSWWSGLLNSDARLGVKMNTGRLTEQRVNGKTYWFSAGSSVFGQAASEPAAPIVHLLPAYDEYTIAYKDHGPLLYPEYRQQVIASSGIVILIDGHIAGAWKRTVSKDSVSITLTPFRLFTQAENQALDRAVERYSQFLGLPVLRA